MNKLMKTAAFTMAAVMMVSMTACAKKADPKEVFDSAVKKNAELKDMDMTTDTTMSMTQGDQKMDIATKAELKLNNQGTDKMQYLSNITTTLQGQSVPITMFYKDGYFYTDSQGQKIKYKMDLTKVVEAVQKSKDGAQLTSADMTELTMKEDGDNKIFTYTADPTKLNSLIESVKGIVGSTGINMEDLKMDIKSAGGEYTVNKDGYYTDMKLKIDMDMTVPGQTISLSMDLNGVINNPGKPVEFTLPDTDGYREIELPAEITGSDSGSEAETAQESTAA